MKSIPTVVLAAFAAGLGSLSAIPLPIIPRPVSVRPTTGSFVFSAETSIRHHRQLAGEAALFPSPYIHIGG